MERAKIIDNILMFPKLYSKNHLGKTRVWTVCVLATNEIRGDRKGGAWIPETEKLLHDADAPIGVWYTISGLESGKQTISTPHEITEGKNLGKKNATTPFTQAVSEAFSHFKKKCEDGAVENPDEIVDEKNISFEELLKLKIPMPWRINVMEFHNVKDNWHHVKYPCFVQRKLDGIHFVAVRIDDEKNIDVFARGKKKGAAQTHIAESLQSLEKGIYVFGELWKTGLIRQEITSIAGQDHESGVKEKLELHVFDAFDFDRKSMPFKSRWNLAQKIVEKTSSCIKLVETIIANDQSEINEFYNRVISEGGEGVVIRNFGGLYEYGIFTTKRTFQALKYKPRQDAEFKIIGFKEGVGKMQGQIIFQAITEQGREFWVSPKWSEEKRREWFIEMSKDFSYKNKTATIEFDTYSKTGIPLQPYLISF